MSLLAQLVESRADNKVLSSTHVSILFCWEWVKIKG